MEDAVQNAVYVAGLSDALDSGAIWQEGWKPMQDLPVLEPAHGAPVCRDDEAPLAFGTSNDKPACRREI
jgi:hypothetical protein